MLLEFRVVVLLNTSAKGGTVRNEALKYKLQEKPCAANPNRYGCKSKLEGTLLAIVARVPLGPNAASWLQVSHSLNS